MLFIKRNVFTSLLMIIALTLPLNVMAASTTPTVPATTENTTIPDGDPPSGENVQGKEQTVEVEAQTPASVTGEIMQGNGTVVDYTTTGSKAFYTIVDTDQNTFYLVIDMDKTQNNVYFLKSVTQTELEGAPANAEVNEPEPEPVPAPAVVSQETTEEESGGLGFTLIVVLLAAGGVAAYYFLVMRKRHQNNNNEENEEDKMDENNDWEEEHHDKDKELQR